MCEYEIWPATNEKCDDCGMDASVIHVYNLYYDSIEVKFTSLCDDCARIKEEKWDEE